MKKTEKPVFEAKIVKKKEKVKEFNDIMVQTEEEQEKNLNIQSIEISKILSLKKSIKKFNISRLTQKLHDIYDKMKVIQFEIPSGVQKPEIPEINFSLISKNEPETQALLKNIEKLNKIENKFKGALMLYKETQTDDHRDNQNTNFEFDIDKELSLMKKNREFDGLVAENKILKEKITKLEKSQNFESSKGALHEENNLLSQTDENENFQELSFKQRYEKLYDKNNSQLKKLEKLETQLFNTKVL